MMEFLLGLVRRFLGLGKGVQQADSRPQVVPYELGQDELVSRFIYSKQHFSSSSKLVRPNAFNPPSEGGLSVAHTTSLGEDEVWAIGRQTLRDAPGRSTLRARGDLKVRRITKEKLVTMRDDRPFVRHASIEGWPTLDDKDQQKKLRKAIAAELSQDAELRIAILPITP